MLKFAWVVAVPPHMSRFAGAASCARCGRRFGLAGRPGTSADAAPRGDLVPMAGPAISAIRRTVPSRRPRAAPTRRQSAEPKKEAGFGDMPKGPLQIVVTISTQKVTLLQQRRAGRAGAGLDRRARPSDADGRLQHHREGPLPPLQSSIAARRCRSCSASPGPAWPCTRASCRAIRPRTAASACRTISRRSCGPSPSSACALSSRATSWRRSTSSIPSCSCPSTSPPSHGSRGTRDRRTQRAPPPVAIRRDAGSPRCHSRNNDGAPASRPASDNPGRAGEAVATVNRWSYRGSPSTGCCRRPLPRPAIAEIRRDADVAPSPAEAAPAGRRPRKPAPALDPAKPAAPARRSRPTSRSSAAGQVAVFVSRKEKKIFVRQGMVPLFDMPIMIEDPDQLPRHSRLHCHGGETTAPDALEPDDHPDRRLGSSSSTRDARRTFREPPRTSDRLEAALDRGGGAQPHSRCRRKRSTASASS